jgi:hypothetical protein
LHFGRADCARRLGWTYELLEHFHAWLANKTAAYVHIPYAKFGCYAARVDRA